MQTKSSEMNIAVVMGFIVGVIVAMLCFTGFTQNQAVNSEGRDRFWQHITDACRKQGKVPVVVDEVQPNRWVRLQVGCDDES